ncbi:hypothetical protein [Ilumatobacter sp.]
MSAAICGNAAAGTATTFGEGATTDSAKIESGNPSAMTPDLDRV